jgi:hypothetical protein
VSPEQILQVAIGFMAERGIPLGDPASSTDAGYSRPDPRQRCTGCGPTTARLRSLRRSLRAAALAAHDRIVVSTAGGTAMSILTDQLRWRRHRRLGRLLQRNARWVTEARHTPPLWALYGSRRPTPR